MDGAEAPPRGPSPRPRCKRWAQREGIRGQADGNQNHRQLASLITWIKALSNSMKLSHAVSGHPRWRGHGGEV